MHFFVCGAVASESGTCCIGVKRIIIYRVRVLHEKGSRNEKGLREQVQKSNGAGDVAMTEIVSGAVRRSFWKGMDHVVCARGHASEEKLPFILVASAGIPRIDGTQE